MNRFIQRYDAIAGISNQNSLITALERISFLFLLLMAFFAPHSIAASQTAWLCGLLLTAIRFAIKPRPGIFRNKLNLALAIFGVWSVITAIFSYAPAISIDKLRGVGLLFIFFFVIYNLRTKKAVISIAYVLVISCLFNVIMTPIQRLIGRGVEISGISNESIFTKSEFLEHSSIKIHDGDTILEVNSKKVSSADQLIAEIEKSENVEIKIYRPDYYNFYGLNKKDLLPGNTAEEKLGIVSWKPSHNWRSQAFYSHFTTYAEVLQLIASLIFGLLIAAIVQTNNRRNQILLAGCLTLFLLALLLTVTRASQAAFLVSSFAMLTFGSNRKLLLAAILIAIPAAAIGLIFLQESRNVGFYDTSDNSITWRQTVYKEGLNLAVKSPRNITIGVGMDSIKRFAGEWHLFDDGKLPMGHFHSTLLQLLVERGLPALLIWFWILWLYGNTLWKSIRDGEFADWRCYGIILGSFGGMIGFFTSGIVHYNLGDGEVAMVFYLLMGLSVFLATKNQELSNE